MTVMLWGYPAERVRDVLFAAKAWRRDVARIANTATGPAANLISAVDRLTETGPPAAPESPPAAEPADTIHPDTRAANAAFMAARDAAEQAKPVLRAPRSHEPGTIGPGGSAVLDRIQAEQFGCPVDHLPGCLGDRGVVHQTCPACQATPAPQDTRLQLDVIHRQSTAPNGPAGLSVEQEIRARAVDAAVRFWHRMQVTGNTIDASLFDFADQLATYIRDGREPR